MKMMTKELKEKLLKAKDGDDKVIVHYFSMTGWDWYITHAEEWENGDLCLFGYVCGDANEWGSVMLSELEELNKMYLVERDLYPQDDLTAYEYAKYNGHAAGEICD